MLFLHIGCLTSSKVLKVNDLEYNIVSVSANIVLKYSSFNILPCLTRSDNRVSSTEWIFLYQTPPMWIAAGGFLCPAIKSEPRFYKRCWHFWWSISTKSFENSLWYPKKLGSLSQGRFFIFSLLVINIRKACINGSVPILKMDSKWKSLIAERVKSFP